MDVTKQKKVDKNLAVEERIEFLRYAAKKYETDGSSPISDKDYDIEFAELKKLDPDNEFFDEVGGISDAIQGELVPHEIVMGSLNKSADIEEFKQWLMSKYPKNYDGIFVLMHKVDGLSLSLHYKGGKLVQALTRGDGQKGVEVTDKAKTVKGVLHNISDKRDIEVRGEVFKDKFDFYKKWHVSVMQGGYKHPRNFSSGKMNEKNPDETKKAALEFVAYEEVRIDWNTETEKNDWLEKQGFETLNSSTKRTKNGITLEQVVAAVKYYMDNIDRANLRYDIDGIVVKLNDVKLMKKMGYDSRGRKPSANRAVKFLPEEKESILLDIEVNVGRTGKLCPIGILKPVELGGAMIGRVTLHNFGALVGKDAIKKDAIVKIQKRGDIIPGITAVKTNGDKNFSIPTACPSCGEKVEWTDGNVDLVCNNPDCVAQLNRKIEKWFDVIGVKGFGKGTIAKLTDKEEMEWEGRAIIESLEEMYYMLDNDRESAHPFRKYEMIKSAIGLKTYENLLTSIKAIKEVTLPIFIEALGIGRIGSSSVDIAAIAPTIEDVDKLTKDDLLKIDRFGETKAESFINAWKNRRDEIKKLLEFVTIKAVKKASNNLDGKTFCFTGSFDSPDRKSMEKMVSDNGGKLASVSKNLTALVADGECQKGKFEKAQSLGIPIISQEEFLALLK